MGLAALAVLALSTPGTAAVTPSVATALDAAMTPGIGQKRLDEMVGTFKVTIRTWATPTSAPVNSSGVAIIGWVLGGRYLQSNISGFVGGQPFNGLGFTGYDNTAGVYQSTWMDNGSTGQVWYKGGFTPGSKSAVMKASVADPVTGKPSPLEMRMTIFPNGTHSTELWGMGTGTTMFKMMELHYTRSK
jgi:hypothetical protein